MKVIMILNNHSYNKISYILLLPILSSDIMYFEKPYLK